jgi:hypothetical protein
MPIAKAQMKTTLIIASGGDTTQEYNYLERLSEFQQNKALF